MTIRMPLFVFVLCVITLVISIVTRIQTNKVKQLQEEVTSHSRIIYKHVDVYDVALSNIQVSYAIPHGSELLSIDLHYRQGSNVMEHTFYTDELHIRKQSK